MKLFYPLGIFLLCLFVTPLALCIAVVILLDSGFPVLFRQRRIGKNGKAFTIFKFRTMRVGAEKLQSTLRRLNEATGPVFKMYHDPRFTRSGAFLAHTGLDELPQLWNVIIGDMVIIGPRPLPVSEASKLTAMQKKRHDILPGIISPAVIDGKYHDDFALWMKNDVAYLQEKSMVFDLRVAGRMVVAFMRLVKRAILSN